MNSFQLAWRNLFRHKRRLLLTLIGLSLSLTLVQTFHNFTKGVYSYMVETGVRSGSGHIVICRNNYLETKDSNIFFIPGDLAKKVSAVTGVQSVLPRVELSGLAQSSRESRNIRIAGVDIPKEKAINPFLKDVPKDLFAKPWRKGDALVGKVLMNELQIKPGQKFVVTTQTCKGELVSELFRVKGVLATGIREVDSSLVMISNEKAAAMYSVPGATHELAVVLEDNGFVDKVFPVIKDLLNDRNGLMTCSWVKAMPNLYNAIRWDYVSMKFLSMIVLMIMTIGVMNTLLMGVMERIYEFGVLKAIGTSPEQLRTMIMAEALLLGIAAVILGSALTSIATVYLVHYGFDLRLFIPANLEFGGVLFSALLYAQWDVSWMCKFALYLLMLCLLASVYPAAKASNISPVKALRHV
ncbi:FtsX-like permease family protein [Maridesulfovibrio sp.]|uniref:ABC transporter permease n=1 Tax=Maridesulfovibrio sp. TaxID=2795000 RepID=UPI0029C9DB84|nr:FtsX-like permease family protein [Maridesulfovibrio sp.]